jgi:hypothetical protein
MEKQKRGTAEAGRSTPETICGLATEGSQAWASYPLGQVGRPTWLGMSERLQLFENVCGLDRQDRREDSIARHAWAIVIARRAGKSRQKMGKTWSGREDRSRCRVRLAAADFFCSYSTLNNSDRIWYSVSQKLPRSDEQELKEADQREDPSASTTSDPICSCFFFFSCTSKVI